MLLKCLELYPRHSNWNMYTTVCILLQLEILLTNPNNHDKIDIYIIFTHAAYTGIYNLNLFGWLNKKLMNHILRTHYWPEFVPERIDTASRLWHSLILKKSCRHFQVSSKRMHIPYWNLPFWGCVWIQGFVLASFPLSMYHLTTFFTPSSSAEPWRSPEVQNFSVSSVTSSPCYILNLLCLRKS